MSHHPSPTPLGGRRWYSRMVVGGGLRGGHLLDNVVSSEDKEGDGSLSRGCR